jgi:hypothetical protein
MYKNLVCFYCTLKEKLKYDQSERSINFGHTPAGCHGYTGIKNFARAIIGEMHHNRELLCLREYPAAWLHDVERREAGSRKEHCSELKKF